MEKGLTFLNFSRKAIKVSFSAGEAFSFKLVHSKLSNLDSLFLEYILNVSDYLHICKYSGKIY